MSSELNPRTKHYEFLGPPGAFLISIGIPAVTYALYFGCSEVTGGCPPQINGDHVVHALTDATWWKSLWDTQAATAYFAWYAFCVVAWAILPGDLVAGTKLRNGGRKKYKINAFSTFLLALGATTGYIMRYGPESFTFIYHKWVGLVTAAILMSLIQATYCYASSFKSGALLALGGNSGNILYDWYIGRELNPSIGSLELKSFNELRPGLILWVLINISMVCEQAVRRGGFRNVTDSMWLVLAFHSWYVADGLYNEPALFTTMDIVTDGFGFMLAVGDLVVVPFTYTVQSRYLAFHPVELGPFWTIGILAFKFVGYYIFRSSNGEKNDFRNGKNPKNLTYMETKRGTKLLTSGWWGWSRHPNYFGDWMMGISWCLPTGANTPITYYYALYFAILLIHRQLRDEEACQEKYGDDWKRYKKLVPYRIIPYIY
ncbi:ergosterol biosynthesis ERG4/ERG24 [Crepidotus variabilis]|uniref:Delta(14)-sterol reductase ERG24 n=1 Tax=Crepidotus variabilis TaxID=179855 RepID=A0A9P6EID2_9AGAR|nr:ergosterol biosynthesis ERG4/ERG24 [Crepidotus variabilis]